jgi:hypothetical protein
MYAVIITAASGLTYRAHTSPTYLRAREWVRRLTHESWMLRIQIEDLQGDAVTLWDRGWTKESKHAGLYR